MQTGCPFRLKIEWAWPENIEKDLHFEFAKYRQSGEWFCVPVELAIQVAGMLAKRKYAESN
jgi:hypothetical protein